MQTTEWQTIKARLKATWEAGDFGQIAQFNDLSVQAFSSPLTTSPENLPPLTASQA